MKLLLPKETIKQKLDREELHSFCDKIKNYIEKLYKENKEELIIQDGPPYANGDLHIGHFLNKTLKDFYIKYFSTTGYKVKVRFGWDCHGLPIENKAKQMDGDLLENCSAIAKKYRNKQKEILSLFGIFSTEQDYLTMDKDYTDREISIYNKLKDSGFIYRKNKPVWYSPTLKTVLANSEIEYKEIDEYSLYFKLKINDELSFLVWTTTEWTVSGNQAICLNPDISYCITKTGLFCSEKFAIQNKEEYESVEVNKFTHYINHNGEKCPVLFDSFVTDNETGIVHLCGGQGDDDFDVLLKNEIEPKNVTHPNDLLNHIENFRVDEKYVYRRAELKHQYPVDWRNKDKVYKILTEQTYLDFDWNKIKETVKKIKLSSKDRTRLESMLFSRKDWCLSRQRTWGVKIPDTNDILDVWFDSGTAFSMNDVPADLYIEGTDQHRGWFQSSVIIAAMIGCVPTKRILTHGFVINELGEKYSKSAENFTPLEEMYNDYNPDVMRLWVLFSDYKNDVMLSEESMKSAGKQYFRFRNFLRYLINNLHRSEHLHVDIRIDLKTEIEKLKESIKFDINNFDLNKAVRSIVNFTNKYSSYLTEDMKNKFYESDIDDEYRIMLENEFHYLSNELSDILFPFLPFLSVEIKNSL